MTDLNLHAPISMLFVRAGVSEEDRTKDSFDLTQTAKANAVNMVSSNNAVGNIGLGDIDATADANAYGGGGGVNVGGNTLQTYHSHYAGYYWPFYDPYRTYYQNCYQVIPNPDKFETAFKLGRKLMEKKLTKPMKTIEDFFKLMDTIVEVL